VLSLWLRGFKWTCQDDNLGVMNLFFHLGVRELFVDDDAVDEHGVFNGAASLGDDLDFVEVHVTSVHVGNCEHCSDCKVCEVFLTAAHHL
jgi:hypothetical protein